MRVAHSERSEVRLARRVGIVLLCADGLENKLVGEWLGIDRIQVGRWRDRYATGGFEAIAQDRRRGGRKPVVDRLEVVRLTTQSTPEAALHCSTRSLALVAGCSDSTIQRIWKKHGLKPHQVRQFKVWRDLRFVALNILDGQVVVQYQQCHRHTEWLKFLKTINREASKDKTLHLIADNDGTHKQPAVKAWRAKRPRFNMHFTPTSVSWLNMVERFFRDISENRLRRGVFTSVPELIAVIEAYVGNHNKHSKPFIWIATAKDILAKVIRANSHLGSKQNEALQ